MKITYRYEYKDYPEVPELTRISTRVGRMTGTRAKIIYSVIIYLIVFIFLDSTGKFDSTEQTSQIIMLGVPALAVAAVLPLCKTIRDKIHSRLDQKYKEKMENMRQTDPQRYMRAAQEIQRRQNRK